MRNSSDKLNQHSLCKDIWTLNVVGQINGHQRDFSTWQKSALFTMGLWPMVSLSTNLHWKSSLVKTKELSHHSQCALCWQRQKRKTNDTTITSATVNDATSTIDSLLFIHRDQPHTLFYAAHLHGKARLRQHCTYAPHTNRSLSISTNDISLHRLSISLWFVICIELPRWKTFHLLLLLLWKRFILVRSGTMAELLSLSFSAVKRRSSTNRTNVWWRRALFCSNDCCSPSSLFPFHQRSFSEKGELNWHWIVATKQLFNSSELSGEKIALHLCKIFSWWREKIRRCVKEVTSLFLSNRWWSNKCVNHCWVKSSELREKCCLTRRRDLCPNTFTHRDTRSLIGNVALFGVSVVFACERLPLQRLVVCRQ